EVDGEISILVTEDAWIAIDIDVEEGITWQILPDETVEGRNWRHDATHQHRVWLYRINLRNISTKVSHHAWVGGWVERSLTMIGERAVPEWQNHKQGHHADGYDSAAQHSQFSTSVLQSCEGAVDGHVICQRTLSMLAQWTLHKAMSEISK